MLIFHEPFGPRNLAGFACIWTALIIYSIDTYRGYRSATTSDMPAAVEV